MRVLHVITEMGTGGAETLVAGMALAGDQADWTSAVASAGGHRADALRARGVATFAVPAPHRRATGVLRAAHATRWAVREFAPDVVLAHNISASVVSRLAVTGRRIPVVTVFHGVAHVDYPAAARILRRTSRTVVAVADSAAAGLRAAGLPEPVVVPNAVFDQPPARDRATVRADLGLDPTVPVALCVARLEPQKRHDVLLAAWALLDDAVLLLAGDGSRRAALGARCAELGLTGRVRFLGTRRDVPDLLAAADLTVLTSDWEGMPVAVLESLAAGRPVVASDVDGVREVLAGGGGLLVPPGDAVATAEALCALLFDPAARATAAAAGSLYVHTRHNPETLMKTYNEILATAVAGGTR
ncbi:glycosyltransferase [Actinophytocola xinjiangensis]|nr:glycosyltransferase [Actinophytocola xinjiangensis]